MRLLQAMAGAEFGGAEAFFVRLASAFERHGIEQRVLIRDNPKRAALMREAGVGVAELPFGGFFDLKTRFGFRRAIDEYKPDIVLTWMNRATQFCPKGNFVHVGRLGGYYDLKYYMKCKHLIGNTQDIVDYLGKSGWPPEQAHYLPNFVSDETVPPLSRKELFTPPNGFLVLALGRLHENKAFDVLLKAMSHVPEMYLWLAGEGPKRAELEALALQLGIKPRVRFLGWRDDTSALFAAADVFVCPSRHEPLGNVILEAWAQGKPVIAADSLGPGTLISHMENGILVPVDDAKSLYHAIRAIMNDKQMAANLASAGRRAFEENFTEEAVVARYRQFFERICAESPGS
jgi:glycosyltransferase involved in cell wall biosynthesis